MDENVNGISQAVLPLTESLTALDKLAAVVAHPPVVGLLRLRLWSGLNGRRRCVVEAFPDEVE